MLTFTKDVLRHSCSWTTPEEASRQITGFPDTELNVNEGYEVLHFVCRYMACKGWGAQALSRTLNHLLRQGCHLLCAHMHR